MSLTPRWEKAGSPGPGGSTPQRGDTDHAAKSFDLDVDQPVVEAVHQVAGERGVPMAHIAMAWVLSKPVVTAPIVGATKPHHLAGAAASHNVQLTEDEVRRLEARYTTQPAYWW